MIDSLTMETIWTVLIIGLESLLVTVILLVLLAFLLYFDRKVWAAVQMRRGPNVVGPFGLFQSFADFIKYIVKEIIVPSGANKIIFLLAPVISFAFALVAWAVIPFNEGWVLADINLGMLFLFATSSLGVYGIILGGWASNSKYPFFGAMRSTAQMISYEVAIGLVLVNIALITGSLNLSDIVKAQTGDYGAWHWFVIPQLPMFVIFFISALAETNRPPFDLPEAESELVAGYQVEYSSIPFLLYMIAEYLNIVLMCTLMTTLFFGGWLNPLPFGLLGWVPGPVWLLIKVVFFFFLFAMVKAIVPRYRYDQLMRLGWKIFLPFTLVWVLITASYVVFFQV